jgi:CRISPR-associated protein Csm1
MSEQNIKTDYTREKIYLAALLHDIGKFYQRADLMFTDKYNQLSDYSKNMADDICPMNDFGKFGYQHVIWTNEFFEKVQNKIKSIPELKGNIFVQSCLDNLSNFACNHHKPQTLLQSIVTLADWWSAGVDRRKPIEEDSLEKEKSIKWGKERYKKIPLYSIFNTINEGKENMAFPLSPLSINTESFPRKIEAVNDGISHMEYKKLWISFIKEFDELPSDTLTVFTESLIYLLKKYTWCIPSNTMDMANVSLFHHLKTTAAFADCFYQYYMENESAFKWNNTNKRLSLKDNVFPVLLVGCDVSGIQKFIYNISSKKAASSLKGRSFYLQLLIDSIIQKFQLHVDIKATLAHVIYSSGGKFYMLLPNTKIVKNALDKINKEVERELWYKFNGSLFVNFSHIPFAFNNNEKTIDIEIENGKDKNLGNLWKELNDRLVIKKNQKMKSILLEDFDLLFNPKNVANDGNICEITGEDLNKDNLSKIDDLLLSKSSKKMIELGKALKDVDYIITFKGDNENSKYLSNRLKHSETVIGIANYLFDKIELTDDEADFRKITSADVCRVKTINNTNFLAATLKGKQVSYGFQFYGGNVQAKSNVHNKTFEELTEMKEGNVNSETYLGILRMDIDGLGAIFIEGIPDADKSFSAYATLSSHLDWFFSGYINEIRKKFPKNVNIIYSGGDDIFAVGRWDCLIEFAEEVREKFRQFVGRNDISISGGIAIVNNKYPIAKAAEMAGHAEQKAKAIDGKNAFHFLGKTISWDKEFSDVKAKKDELIHLIKNHEMSKGILHRIMLFESIHENNESNKDKEGFVPDLSYYWNAAYYLKRYMENKDQVVKDFCKELQNEMFGSGKIVLISLAARWAELQLKIEGKNDGNE